MYKFRDRDVLLTADDVTCPPRHKDFLNTPLMVSSQPVQL